ncbi:MAG: RluA family pseudouridine synthase [Alphaproteobacteria bacterium]|nr:RluA family pseudouridine synthase [Alphaproteobacteria bacterium]
MESARNAIERVTIADDQGGQRIDRVLARALPALSRSRIQALIAAGTVAADGATIGDANFRVKPGQQLTVVVPAAVAAVPEAQPIALTVVFEDDDLIVIDKPAGLVVHPAAGNPDRTLVNALLHHCGASLSGIGGVRRPGIVHRLDKDTSGLLVVAKNDAAHAALAALFAKHTIERAYWALVWGVPRPTSGEIDGPIGRSRRNRKKMAIVAGGKPALTRYRVVRAFGETAALVECHLATGRTHQIRVHLAARGHPVIGDPTYGGGWRRLAGLPAAIQPLVQRLQRQALHAHLLGFRHPRTAAPLRFRSVIPNDINAIIFLLESKIKNSRVGLSGT